MCSSVTYVGDWCWMAIKWQRSTSFPFFSLPGMAWGQLPVWNEDIFLCSSLEQLSLKCCCLDDAFCAAIHSTLAANRVLIALDLSSNQITDHGLAQLANALRLNRTLLSLCLAGNRIGDDGVIALCQVS